jgi:hypothetical protein
MTGLVVSIRSRSKARGTPKYKSIHKHASKDPAFPYKFRPSMSNRLLIVPFAQ